MSEGDVETTLKYYSYLVLSQSFVIALAACTTLKRFLFKY